MTISAAIATLRIALPTLRLLMSTLAVTGSHPWSFADADPRLHTIQPRFVEHEDVGVVPQIVPWLSPDQQS